ncbi:MAG: GrpB family protein [Burkholderiales bacterium]|nr:GrpB family protein [Opitutaceae bacterium]
MNSTFDDERVSFIRESAIREHVEAAFERHSRELGQLLPDIEIHHIGSTAVAGSLTKGDLDLQLRVAPEQFAHVDTVLACRFARNVGSRHSPTFSSFKDDGAAPPLGIQVTVIGGPEDFFFRMRDYLIKHPEENERYNDLKRRFEGALMREYRAAKSAFWDALEGKI